MQSCHLAFMHWPRSTQVNNWQNGSHVFGMADQQDRVWDFEAMEDDSSFDICMMRPLCERKKLLSAEVPVTMAFIMAAKPVTQLTQNEFLVIGHCHKIG